MASVTLRGVRKSFGTTEGMHGVDMSRRVSRARLPVGLRQNTLLYSFFVEYYVFGMTGAVKE